MNHTKSAPRSKIADDEADVHREKTPFEKGKEAREMTKDESKTARDVRDKVREDYEDLDAKEKEKYRRGWRG